MSVQGHTKLPDYVPLEQFQRTPLRDLFTAASAECLNLLAKCLIYDPKRRISAKEVSISNNIRTFRYTNIVSGPQSSLLLRSAIPITPIEASKTRKEGNNAAR